MLFQTGCSHCQCITDSHRVEMICTGKYPQANLSATHLSGGQQMHDLFSTSQVQIPWCQTIFSAVAFALAPLSEHSMESMAMFPPKYTEVTWETPIYKSAWKTRISNHLSISV